MPKATRKYTKRKPNALKVVWNSRKDTKEIIAPFSKTIYGQKDELEIHARQLHNMIRKGKIPAKKRVWAANKFLRIYQMMNEAHDCVRQVNGKMEGLERAIEIVRADD